MVEGQGSRRGGQVPYGMEVEAEAEQEVANLENGDDEVEDAATTNASNMSSTSRKRKRPNNATMFSEVLRETIGSLDQTIVTAKIGRAHV